MIKTFKRSKKGYVYILTNTSMPNVVKIGKTVRDVNLRAKEISATTGVPTPFEIYFYLETQDCNSLEKKMHSYFRNQRVNKKREFFKITPKKGKKVLKRLNSSLFIGLKLKILFFLLIYFSMRFLY